ncbi:phage tail assembly protein [Brevundimonas sp.]|uniref:phage tail assembly protein n=1 Tax=Brevundimonas sp. TaxID=1871086 RepID=UPI003F71775E
MAMENVTLIPLVSPITLLMRPVGGGEEREETIIQLELHEFEAGDLRAIDGLPDTHKGSMLLALMAKMTRQPVRVIEKLKGPDFKALAEKVQGFLPDGLTDGGTE